MARPAGLSIVGVTSFLTSRPGAEVCQPPAVLQCEKETILANGSVSHPPSQISATASLGGTRFRARLSRGRQLRLFEFVTVEAAYRLRGSQR